jgi:hypothetical protein
MAQVLSPLRWRKSTLAVASKPTLVAQADSGRNLKPAPAAKLLVFSDFSFALAFRKVLFVFFHIKVRSTRQTKVDFQSRISKVRSARRKLDFFSRISKSAPRGILKSTSKVAY